MNNRNDIWEPWSIRAHAKDRHKVVQLVVSMKTEHPRMWYEPPRSKVARGPLSEAVVWCFRWFTRPQLEPKTAGGGWFMDPDAGIPYELGK